MTSPVQAGETWRVPSVELGLDEEAGLLRTRALAALGLPDDPAIDARVVRRAIDARGAREPRFVHSVDCTVPAEFTAKVDRSRGQRIAVEQRPPARRFCGDAARPVVVGAGPCGIFAALWLARAGLRPVLVDRGKPVETRAKDVSRLMGQGVIDGESNLCFGEGGAGTWSDGKLYTRKGGMLPRLVLETLVEFGADPGILVEGRPHLGTDRLVALLKRLRQGLVDAGAEVRYGTRVSRLRSEDGRVTGVDLADGDHIDATQVVLALGHSARDLYVTLSGQGVALQAKPFAVGFRVEHPQALVDRIQYGRWWEHPLLPAAYYELATNVGRDRQRGVYSFCMCPGGSVVPTGTREGEVCVNGMSHAARSGRYANSALVVTVGAEECAGWLEREPESPVLAGMAFQREAEQRAWEAGGGAFVAPAQRLVDYLAGSPASEVRRTTYKRGVQPADLRGLYPPFVQESLSAAMADFARRMPGYVTDDAVLLGVETRTSAPVTILRDARLLQSPTLAGLYPAGEGAGFAGGIVSAAVDGIRVAEQLLATLGEVTAGAVVYG